MCSWSDRRSFRLHNIVSGQTQSTPLFSVLSSWNWVDWVWLVRLRGIDGGHPCDSVCVWNVFPHLLRLLQFSVQFAVKLTTVAANNVTVEKNFSPNCKRALFWCSLSSVQPLSSTSTQDHFRFLRVKTFSPFFNNQNMRVCVTWYNQWIWVTISSDQLQYKLSNPTLIVSYTKETDIQCKCEVVLERETINTLWDKLKHAVRKWSYQATSEHPMLKFTAGLWPL